MPSGVRDDRRYSCAVAVRVRCDSWADYLELHATNISTRGVFVVSEEVVARIGAEVTVDLVLPGGAAVSVPARVVHHDGEAPGMGLRFLDTDAQTHATLGALLAVARQASKIAPQAEAQQTETLRARKRGPVDSVEQRLLDEVAARYELPPHQQLGVELGATAVEIDEAYRRLREKYDRTTFEPCSAEALLLVETLRGFIENAYEQLKPT